MAQIVVVAVMALMALNKGAQESQALKKKAVYAREARNRSQAATTADIAEKERDKERMYSRALAVTAGSGAGVDDPGMVALHGDLNAEGDYRILSTMYTGLTEAEGLRVQSEIARDDAEGALQTGYANAASTVLSYYGGGGGAGAGMFSKAGSSIKGWYANAFKSAGSSSSGSALKYGRGVI